MIETIDGDTVVLDVGGIEETVRLIGIDTPETKHPDRGVECYGQEASDRLAALLPPGTHVRLERDVEARDRYQRLLAYVHRSSDGVFVNLSLALDGFADAAVYPPNTAWTEQIGDAVRTARAEGRGLWSACGGPDVIIDGGG